MNMHESFAPSEDIALCAPAAARPSWLIVVRARFIAWVTTSAQTYGAAVAYEELSRLSDAQLKHRGLTRDILARDVSEECVRASGRHVMANCRAQRPAAEFRV